MSAHRRGAPSAEPRNDVSPGEHLRREIERLGLDQAAVGEAIGVSRQAINNVVSGRQPISRAMAAKLGRLMGRSSDYWLRQSFSFSGGDRQDGEHRPIGVLVNRQIMRAVKDGIIGIEPFTPANVRFAAIELTLDDGIVTSEGVTTAVGGRRKFFLAPGGCVKARTKERIGFPQDYLGHVGALPWLSASGIISSMGFQVAPGFSGQLTFCLFNAGTAKFRLQAGDPMISLEISALSVAPAGAI